MKYAQKTKRMLSIIAAVMLLVAVFSVFASAADQKTQNLNGKYGSILPTDSKLKELVRDYSFTGDSGTLYFMLNSKGQENARFAVEIYESKTYTEENRVRYGSGDFAEKSGKSPINFNFKFSSLSSGKYYGRCYAYVASDSANIIDSSSVTEFTVTIDRLKTKTPALKAAKNAAAGIKVSWTPLQTPTQYYIYRKNADATKWSKIASVSGANKSSYIDKTAKDGVMYTYTVKAVEVVGKTTYTSLYNKNGVSATRLALPELTGVDGSTAKGYAKLTWKPVKSATGYYVYRKGGTLNASWERIATVKGQKSSSYTDKTATNQKWEYTYTVKAYTGSSTSGYDNDGVKFNFLSVPTVKSSIPRVAGLSIKWSCSGSATKFRIYRKNTAGDSWKLIGTSTGRSYLDTTAVSGKTYIYTVRSACATNCGGYDPEGITASYLAAPVFKSLSYANTGAAKLKWEKVAGASGYYIYRSSSENSKMVKIATLKASVTSYTDKAAKTEGVTYKYTIRAYNSKCTSSYYDSLISKMFLKIPVFTLSNEANAIRIDWKAVKSAKSYNLYKKAEGAKYWALLAQNVTDLTFTDEDVENGKSYQYCIRAVNGSSLSNYSAAMITAVSRPVMTDAVLTEGGNEISWEPVENAESYYIFRKAENGKFELLSTYSATTFIDETAEEGVIYYYSAAAEINGSRSDYDPIGVSSGVVPVKIDAVLDTSAEPAAINVSFTLGDDAANYVLYRSEDGGENVPVEDYDFASGEVYTDTNITMGSTYVYTVEASREKKITSTSSAAVKYPFTAAEFTVKSFEATEEEGAYILINWSSVPNTETFTVMRKTVSGEWTDLATFTFEDEFVYKDTDVELDTEYVYTVKGVAPNGDEFYNEEGKKAAVYSPLPEVSYSVAPCRRTDTTEAYVVISWSPVANAEKYLVLRKTTGDWETAATVEAGEETSFTDRTVSFNINYRYTVKAVASDRSSLFDEEGKEAVVFSPLAAAEFTVKGVEAENDEAACIIVNWSPVKGAVSYGIYKKAAEADAWGEPIAKIDADSAPEFRDTDIVIDTVYYYTVRALANDRGSYFNEDGKKCAVYSPIKAVVFTAKGVEPAQIVLNWTPVDFAENYEIYRKGPDDTTWKKLTVLENSGASSYTYTDKKISTETKYYYTIKGTASDRSSLYNTDGIAAAVYKKIEPVEFEVKSFDYEDGVAAHVEITWSAVGNAENYEILRRTAGSDWEVLTTVSSDAAFEYSNYSLETDTLYYYTVKGTAAERNSDFDETGKSAFIYAPVEAVDIELAANRAADGKPANVTITWKAVDNTDGYSVLKYDGDKFVSIAELDNETFEYVDTDIVLDTEYSYKVVGQSKIRRVIEDEAEHKITVESILDAVEFDLTANAVAVGEGPNVTITWSAVDKAEGYEILKKTEGGEFTVLASVDGSTLTYIDEDIEFDTVYYYTVKATAGTKTAEYDKEGKSAVVLTPISEIDDLKGEYDPEEKCAVLTWGAVENADGYNILKKTGTNEWVSLGIVGADTLSFSDSDVQANVQYFYLVLPTSETRTVSSGNNAISFIFDDTPVE